MKSLGLIGGTSWYSTIDYYRYINKMVNERMGGNTNPPLVLYNVNQEKLHQLQAEGGWEKVGMELAAAGNKLKAAGAEGLLLCANTTHIAYDTVQKECGLPVLHIADAIARSIKKKGLNKVGLIGTIFTMEKDFLTGKLKKEHDIDVVVPDKESRELLHSIIFKHLALGDFSEPVKKQTISEINKLKAQGAEGIILGCTEFPILVKQSDLDIPAFDTTALHAEMAVEFILG